MTDPEGNEFCLVPVTHRCSFDFESGHADYLDDLKKLTTAPRIYLQIGFDMDF